jgi:hypothetical protein
MIAILTLVGVVVGGLIAAGGPFLLEQRRQKWASEERKYLTAEKKYLMFAEKRLNALQNVVQLCDFLDSVPYSFVGRVSEGVQADWWRTRREAVAHGALMPESIQEEFKIVLETMAFEPYAADASEVTPPTIPSTEKLRRLCLEAIRSEYEKII